MEFLKEILGEELYSQFASKVNEYNGNEANKDKQIKVANLGNGDYVGKAKYDALQALLDGKTTELTTANDLIADLKKGTKGNEELQGKVTAYETQVEELQKQLAQTQLESEIKVALLGAKATDVDYMTFKLKEKGELEIGEDGKIKGIDEMIAGLKTQFPTQFESVNNGKNIDVNELPKPDDRNTLTKNDILKKPYAERMKLFNENQEAYNNAMRS